MKGKIIIGILAVIVIGGGVIFGIAQNKNKIEDNNEISNNNVETNSEKEENKKSEVSEYTLQKTDLTQYLEKDITSVVDELGLKQLRRSDIGKMTDITGYYSNGELGEYLIVGDSDGDGKVDYLEISQTLGGDKYRIYNLVYNDYTEKIVEEIKNMGYKNVTENPTETGALGGTYHYKYELDNGYNIYLRTNADRKDLVSTIVLMK